MFPCLPPSPRLSPFTSSSIHQRILHALSTCTSTTALRRIQSQILHQGLFRDTTIISSFILSCRRLGHLRPAFHLFSLLPRPHVFVCNTLLRSLSPQQQTPLLLFSHILRSAVSPNRFTLPILLKSLSLPLHARLIHALGVKYGLISDLYVQNSLLRVYSGDIDDAEKMFDEMPVRNVITWTTLIDGYKDCGKFADSIATFNSMLLSGISPNRVTMITTLGACAGLGAIDTGMWIHDYVKRNRWVIDVKLGTLLVDTYCKCGQVDAAVDVFSSMSERNVYTWNSLIGGLAKAKRGLEALRWFSEMEQEGVQPDGITLINVLCACSHGGLVEAGMQIFSSLLNGRYGFSPWIKHYGCMVGLLGHAGYLSEAHELVERMPMSPNAAIWGLLFHGCKKHGFVKLSEVAVRQLIELQPGNFA